MADNQFASTIGALFQGMDEFVTTKTVVGEPVTVGDAIILPLVDVTCGMAAGAFGQSAKEKNAGGMSAKMTPSAMRVLRHIFPRKLSGQFTFGVEDPYLMGQILSLAAFLYPVYGKKIDLTPVMDANALDGELSFRGRVQIGVLALMALRIWMDKNVRTQVYKYRNRGGR